MFGCGLAWKVLLDPPGGPPLSPRRVWPPCPPAPISASSTLVLEGDVEVERLELDGALVVRAAPGAAVRVAALAVRNAGWRFVPLEEPEAAAAPEHLRIRGYGLRREGERRLCFPEPGQYVVDEPG